MLSNIHAWAAKTKLNMAILLAVFAVLGVFAKTYLSAATATQIADGLANVADCGQVAACPPVSPTTVQ